jgi:glutaredoxin
VKRLTGRRTVPNVIVDHTSIGGADEVSLMDSEGSLRTLLMRGQTNQ